MSMFENPAGRAPASGKALVAPSAAEVPGAATLPGRNRIRNGAFTVNQRGLTGTVTLAAGAYGHDGFKAGASGCTYTIASSGNGDVTLTITAGTLLQVIEGPLYVPEGGPYVLSWSGSALARVYQGSASGAYAASPITTPDLTAGTSVTVEFGTGTLTRAQFEPGTLATGFERRDDEIRRCARYYQRAVLTLSRLSGAAAFNGGFQNLRLAPMRTTPTASISNTTGGSYGGALGADSLSANVDVRVYFAAAGAEGDWTNALLTLSAEL